MSKMSSRRRFRLKQRGDINYVLEQREVYQLLSNGLDWWFGGSGFPCKVLQEGAKKKTIKTTSPIKLKKYLT